MKKLILTLLLLVVQVINAQTFIEKAETKAVSSIDEFIEKYSPVLDEKLDSIWTFAKSTGNSLYDSFIRYLIFKDSYPIILWLMFLIIVYFFTKRLSTLIKNYDIKFDFLEKKADFTSYEVISINKKNNLFGIYNKIISALPTLIYYSSFVFAIYKITPYLYNLGLLIIAPEARALMEISQIYKSL